MVRPEVLQVGFDGMVGAAGGYVEVAGEVLADRRFPEELAARAVELLDRYRVAYLLECADGLYGRPGLEDRLIDLLGNLLKSPDTSSHEGPRDILDHLTTTDDLTVARFGKVTCFDADIPISEIAQQIGPEVGWVPASLPGFGDDAGEIHQHGIHKAVGIEIACEALGLSRSHVVAAGDGMNDLEALQYAGTAIGITGADPRILAEADLVAAPPEQEGLVSAFRELGLLA